MPGTQEATGAAGPRGTPGPREGGATARPHGHGTGGPAGHPGGDHPEGATAAQFKQGATSVPNAAI